MRSLYRTIVIQLLRMAMMDISGAMLADQPAPPHDAAGMDALAVLLKETSK